MADDVRYAVFLFPQAIETLGEAIKPYVIEGSAGAHIVCSSVDASGAFFQMTVPSQDQHGNQIDAELMLPNPCVKMVVSIHNDHEFGFGGKR
jgi:hypothetical protein